MLASGFAKIIWKWSGAFFSSWLKPASASFPNTECLADHGKGYIGGREAADDQHAYLDHIGKTDHLHAAQCDKYGEDGKGDHDQWNWFSTAADEVIDRNAAEVIR